MHQIHRSPDPRFALTKNISPVFCMVHETHTAVVHVDCPAYVLHYITQCDVTSCASVRKVRSAEARIPLWHE